jgi:hypothetical protein
MANIQTSSQETTDASHRFEFEYVTAATPTAAEDHGLPWALGTWVVEELGADEIYAALAAHLSTAGGC